MSHSDSWAEPSPDRTSLHMYPWSWRLYKYGLGGLFIINSLWALYVLIKGRKEIFKKVHAFVMNVLLLLMGCLRAGLLFKDPYLSPPNNAELFVFELIIFGLGSAFSVSAFTILLFILLETTNLKFGPARFKQLRYPLSITLLYIIFFVTSDIVVVLYPEAKIVLLVCQIIYVVWGVLVCLGFALTAWKIWQNLRPSRNLACYNNQFNSEVKQMKTLVYLLTMASFTGGISFILKMLTVTSDLSMFGKNRHVEYWSWYGLTFGSLITELMINTLIYAIALRTCIRTHRTRLNRVAVIRRTSHPFQSRSQQRL